MPQGSEATAASEGDGDADADAVRGQPHRISWARLLRLLRGPEARFIIGQVMQVNGEAFVGG